MRPLIYIVGKIKGIRIKSYKAAIVASVIMHATIMTALGFWGTDISESIIDDKLVLEEEITMTEYEVSYVSLETEITESFELPVAPAQPSIEVQGEEPDPMEYITYRTETTVLTGASGKTRGYISGAVVENLEVSYLSEEALPTLPEVPLEVKKEKDLYYYLIGGIQSGNGTGNSGHGFGANTIGSGNGRGTIAMPGIKRPPGKGKGGKGGKGKGGKGKGGKGKGGKGKCG